jgi:hypothetical protein
MQELPEVMSMDGAKSRHAAYAVATAMLVLVLLQAVTAMVPTFAPASPTAEYVPPAAVLNLVRSI